MLNHLKSSAFDTCFNFSNYGEDSFSEFSLDDSPCAHSCKSFAKHTTVVSMTSDGKLQTPNFLVSSANFPCE